MEAAMALFRKIDDFRWELPKQGAMRVPGLVFASEKLLGKIERERVAEQVANVACLPGIVAFSMAMPDAHWGYGFPVGGVAATDVEQGGAISPGGIGFDISCGVRLLRSNLREEDVRPRFDKLMDALFWAAPSGVGSEGTLRLTPKELRKVLEKGARWAIERGLGSREDLETVEDAGALAGADPELPSERALERGKNQLGTLGSGNHFLEVQVVDRVFEQGVGAAYGLFEGQVVVLIHTGSRGFGYQVCQDALDRMQDAAARYHYTLPDRQLACAPFASSEGRHYHASMYAAANYARANRQVLTHSTREAFMKSLELTPAELDMRVVYDVSHNLGKLEEHEVDGRLRKLCVHRKGATRAFPAGHPDVPEPYRDVGQPVLLPGSMGTASYVLVGTERALNETFGTTAHGAGRQMSRTQASKQVKGAELRRRLEARGIAVRTASLKGLAEEAPEAYKDVSEVVEVCEKAGLARPVARMKPIGVVKG
jgi:tRNA-splicing ligase RtcB (3'-phosphate/5'-hydroxy nucleic acid ligase)